ncbi:unnamed protein product [Rhizopus stolonifer]
MNRDLNHAVRVEKEKQAGILKEKELEKKRSLQLSSQLEEKTKQFQKLQNMYEKLKRKTIAPNIQWQQHNPIHTNSSVITSASIMYYRKHHLFLISNNLVTLFPELVKQMAQELFYQCQTI